MKNTIRQAVSALALSAMGLGAFAPSAFAYENPNGGQHFDRGRFPRTYRVGETGPKITCPGPECTQEFINDAVQRGVMTPKEAQQIRKIQSKPQSSAARTKVGGGNSLAIAGGLAAVLGVALAVGSGKSKPASP